MVCPWGKTDCRYETVNGNLDKSLQCWLYYIEECDEKASLYKSIVSDMKRTEEK